MQIGKIFINRVFMGALLLWVAAPVLAGTVFQPAGTNLTYGDVTHGQRVQSASGNPAAAAAELSRGSKKSARGGVLSGAAGLEYGNIDDLFKFYDNLVKAYKPRGNDGPGGGGPDNPGGGISIGDIWDSLDPNFQETIAAVAGEVARQVALAAIIRSEGYGRAWLAADAPFMIGREHLGGAWTFGVNWSGTSKAFGLMQKIEFDPDVARRALEDWFDQLPIDRPPQVQLSDQVQVTIDPQSGTVRFALRNDSSIVTKAAQVTGLEFGYSRQFGSFESGKLFLGAEAKLYLMRLSRASVRFGDITDSEILFDAIRHDSFRNSNRLGADLGALWMGDNYQLGAQLTNVNEPTFDFPDVDLGRYSQPEIIDLIERDQRYRMERQLKFEASLFASDRHWSTHLGVDANSMADPLGDEYQWLTLSAGVTTSSSWVPGFRFGYRQNLAGTKLSYLSLGITAFKIVNFDISSALDAVEIDGTKLPRGLMGSIGFQLSW